jgi:hypothetical protein
MEGFGGEGQKNGRLGFTSVFGFFFSLMTCLSFSLKKDPRPSTGSSPVIMNRRGSESLEFMVKSNS